MVLSSQEDNDWWFPTAIEKRFKFLVWQLQISVSTCQWDNMSWIISIYMYRMTLLYVHLAMININERVMGCTDDPQAPSSHRDSYKFTKTHAAMNFKTYIL